MWQMMYNHYMESSERGAETIAILRSEIAAMERDIDRWRDEYSHIQLLGAANHSLALESMNECAILRQLVLDLYAAIRPSRRYLFERRVNRMIDEEVIDLLTDEEL